MMSTRVGAKSRVAIFRGDNVGCACFPDGTCMFFRLDLRESLCRADVKRRCVKKTRSPKPYIQTPKP